MNKALVFLGIGFELIAMCMGGLYLGDAIDRHFGWQSTSAYLIVLLLIAWFVHLFYLLRKFEKDDDDSNDIQAGPQS